MVSSASRRISSCPVVIGKVRRVDDDVLDRACPSCAVRSSISRSATRTFHSAVRAWPSSSMQQRDDRRAVLVARAASPAAYREPGPSPSSKLTELTIAAAAEHLQARPRSTSGSVESSMIGSVDAVANRPASSRMSATPSRPT